jgi:hypothetical protein
MKKAIIFALFTSLLAVSGANAKTKNSRSNYSKAQQKAFFDEALRVCRKKYRSSLHDVKVDYVKRQYICYVY